MLNRKLIHTFYRDPKFIELFHADLDEATIDFLASYPEQMTSLVE